MTEARQKIKDALIYYIDIRKFPDVTVSELTQLAQVGRSTFYRNYHDIYEVYESLVDDFLEKSTGIAYLSLIERSVSQGEIAEFLNRRELINESIGFNDRDAIVFDYIFDSRDFILIKSLHDKVLRMVADYQRQEGKSEEEANFYAKFCTSACILDTVAKYKKRNSFELDILPIAIRALIGGAEDV